MLRKSVRLTYAEDKLGTLCWTGSVVSLRNYLCYRENDFPDIHWTLKTWPTAGHLHCVKCVLSGKELPLRPQRNRRNSPTEIVSRVTSQ